MREIDMGSEWVMGIVSLILEAILDTSNRTDVRGYVFHGLGLIWCTSINPLVWSNRQDVRFDRYASVQVRYLMYFRQKYIFSDYFYIELLRYRMMFQVAPFIFQDECSAIRQIHIGFWFGLVEFLPNVN